LENGRLHIKISDFGISKRIPLCEDLSVGLRTAQRGLREVAYLAPEVNAFAGDNSIFTPGADSWSVGCTLYRLITGIDIFPGSLLAHQYFHTGQPSPRDGLVAKSHSEASISFIEACLKRQPEARLTAISALEHPWLLVNDGYEVSKCLQGKLNQRKPRTTWRESYVLS